MEKLYFYLYVISGSTSSEKAIIDIKNFCETDIVTNYEFIIIDLLQDNYLIEENKIFVTPTLVYSHSTEEIRLVGDFSDKIKLIQMLELEKVYG
ncbi:MAG: hypothetical protein IPL26_14620 [Leptospiraceae bacterium]|nr:hypothetical protein [Leptospiraceae bacterium]